MKKSELKNMIKECVKEVIFEEGVLSGIIAEVAQGLRGSSVLNETPSPQTAHAPPPTQAEESKRQVLAAIAQNSYEDVKQQFANPSLFEGTQPIPSDTGRGALSGIDPGDPGVDLTNIPGAASWGAIATGNRK